MFLDSINPKLFSPLSSPNARLYGIGLWALYKRLVVNQLDGSECTPQEARSAIKNELIMQNQAEPTWELSTDEEVILEDGNESEDAHRIYRYLRDCGWLMEMHETGYRQITYFPQVAAKILSAFDSINSVQSATIGATCQGVYTALVSAFEKPVEQANQIEFAAKTSRTFFAELNNVAASSREILQRMREEKAGAQMFSVFFNDFMQGLILGDYSNIKAYHHPYRYRATTLSVIVDIKNSRTVMEKLVESVAREQNNEDKEQVKVQLNKDLDDIYRVFMNIEKIMERIEWYRSTMTRRTREAMQYSYRAIPDVGIRISDLVKSLGAMENSDEMVPAPLMSEAYISPGRLYTPRVKAPPAEETTIAKTQPPIEQIAMSRAYDDYLFRRTIRPERIQNYLEVQLGDKNSITTSEMAIEGLDDFVAFMQIRDLLHDAVSVKNPCRNLIKHYKVSVVPEQTMDNGYLKAPELKVERRTPPPKGKKTNVA